MNIAILTPTFSSFSGIDRVVEKEAMELKKKGNTVAIFCFRAQLKSKYAKVIELGMPKNPTLERIYRLFFFLDALKIKHILGKLRGYDRIICHQYPMTIIGSQAKKKYGIEYIYHDAGVAFPGLFSSILERTYMRLFRWFTNKSIQNADRVISISKFLQDVLKKETGIKSTIEYVQIDTSRFKKGISGEKIRRKYKIGNSHLCLYVGRISPHKGIHLLILAFQLVLKQVPDAKLLIVGKATFDNYSKQLKQLAMKVNPKAIIFAGFVSDKDLPEYYAACDVYTTATLWEGYDMPIAEASACGRPSVAFDIGAHPEVLKNGKMVKAGDVKGFANAVINYIKREK